MVVVVPLLMIGCCCCFVVDVVVVVDLYRDFTNVDITATGSLALSTQLL